MVSTIYVVKQACIIIFNNFSIQCSSLLDEERKEEFMDDIIDLYEDIREDHYESLTEKKYLSTSSLHVFTNSVTTNIRIFSPDYICLLFYEVQFFYWGQTIWIDVIFITFLVFWSKWPENEKISCHFQAKCRFFSFLVTVTEKRKMEWTGQKADVTVYVNKKRLYAGHKRKKEN